MTKLEVFLVILIDCSILAYFYVNVFSKPVYEERIYPFKRENGTSEETYINTTLKIATIHSVFCCLFLKNTMKFRKDT